MFSRQVSRTLLRQSLSLNAAARANHVTLRCFGVAARKPVVVEPTPESADMIRDYIKGLMDKQQDSEVVLKPITNEELEQSLEQFQALFDEANACIADCEDASTESLEEEGKTASEAVDRAFAAYIDLLEDLRRADDTQEDYYKDAREQNATRLKLLRRELDGIVQATSQSKP